MRATAKGVVGQRLLVAKRQFELWRRGCRGPGRIPTELWVLAAEAAAELGIEETACQLQVNAERLEQWVEQLGLPGGSNGSAGAEFVELSPMPWGPPGECQVEIEEPSGRKLRISLTLCTVAAGRQPVYRMVTDAP
jgi:2-iminoacetate synthase ThiH